MTERLFELNHYEDLHHTKNSTDVKSLNQIHTDRLYLFVPINTLYNTTRCKTYINNNARHYFFIMIA